jgi:hypothetical protein
MISKIQQSRHFEPFTTAQGSRTFPTVGKIRGAHGGDVSGEPCYSPRMLDYFVI